MTVLNTFLAVAGWAWTVLVLCFAGGYWVGYKAARRDAAGGSVDAPQSLPTL